VDLGIRNKVALVTGASSGIGRAVALALAAEGVRLAVAARRRDETEAVAAAALAAGAADARAFHVDLAHADEGERLVADVSAAFGSVEILVVNAGGPKAGRFLGMTPQSWDEAYRLVMKAKICLIEAVLDDMRAKKFGRIVSLESASVKQPMPNMVLSNAFRVGMVGALKTLAGEVAADGVTVNVIATGKVETDRFRSLYGKDANALAAIAKSVPVGRVASPEEYAPLVAFLCGVPASYVTGQTIAIDGGATQSLL
jgi:3-oxoacyl-[acyl-carrier protein] reductase